ncbi:hypothetical protein J3E73DRAFT_384901 [Bipolaris maydis]|nr:hypothetical protein J3E73DRAFT_384901 [Bipolaris maydis]
MKLLTLNFLTCAIKACKTNPASFPLHPRDAELEIVEADLGLPELPPTAPTPADLVEPSSSSASALDTAEATPTGEAQEEEEEPSQTAKDLHRILLETCIKEGKLVCGACQHEYAVKEGVANFLLPGHLV